MKIYFVTEYNFENLSQRNYHSNTIWNLGIKCFANFHKTFLVFFRYAYSQEPPSKDVEYLLKSTIHQLSPFTIDNSIFKIVQQIFLEAQLLFSTIINIVDIHYKQIFSNKLTNIFFKTNINSFIISKENLLIFSV